MAPYSEAAQAALLRWVNTFPLELKAKSLEDLSDGEILSQVLEDIDSTYNRRTLAHKKNPVQSVIEGTRRFLTTKCSEVGTIVESPAFKALASDKRTTDIYELVTFLLTAATNCEETAPYIERIVGMNEEDQHQIQDILQKRMAEARKYRDTPGDTGLYKPPPPAPVTDIELELEVRYATILTQKRQLEQENDRTRNQMADLQTRLEHLQESHDILRERLEQTQDELNAPKRDDATSMFIKRLEDKIREQDELIESQEGQVDQDRDEKARMRRELESLKDAAARKIQLEDELRELRLESIELAKKANTADRFKQKLEAQKALENDLKNAEYENEHLRTTLRDFNRLNQRNESLEQTHLQFQNRVQKAEMEIFEILSQKKLLEEEKISLERSLAIMEEKRAHDEQFIQDLQDEARLRPSAMPFDSLADELESEDQAQNQNSLEISRLRAEIALLKGNAFAAQENATLRSQLEEADAYRKVIEAKYRDAFEKEAISQQQLRLMMNSVEDNTKFVELAMSINRLVLLTPEYYRHQAFVDLKQSHILLTDEFASLQKKYDSLNAEHEEAKRELLELSSDLNLIEKDDIDKLEEFKATQEALAASFEAELTALKSKNKALEIDFDLQKSQLMESLLINAKLRNTVEESIGTGSVLLDTKERKPVDVSKPLPVRTMKSFGSRSNVVIPERIIRASDVAAELVTGRAVSYDRQTVTPPTTMRSPSLRSVKAPNPQSPQRRPSFMADIPLSPAPSIKFFSPRTRRPSAVALPIGKPATPRGELFKVGLGRSLTAAFTGGRSSETGGRSSLSENRGRDIRTPGTDYSNRDSFEDIIDYEDIDVVLAPDPFYVAPKHLTTVIPSQDHIWPSPSAAEICHARVETVQRTNAQRQVELTVATDKQEHVEPGPSSGELFEVSFTLDSDEKTSAQRQAELIEEAKQRKVDRETVEKAKAVSEKKPFFGKLFRKK